jgi:hypothetical protein
MEAFSPGEHVIIERMDEKTVAGFLMDYTDEGWVLNVTHKEFTIVHVVAPELKADIRSQLAAKSTVHLRAAAVLSGSLTGLVAKRYDVIEFLAGLFEEKLISKYDATSQLRELKSPVKTLIYHEAIDTMESTNDRNISEQLNGFDVDGTLEAILTEGLTSEEDAGTIVVDEGETPSAESDHRS